MALEFPGRPVGSTDGLLRITVKKNGVLLDFTGATIVFRSVNNETRERKVDDQPATSPSAGVLQYQPVLADVDCVGIYACRFFATGLPGGTTYVSPKFLWQIESVSR